MLWFSKSGELTSGHLGQTEYKLLYPETMITKETAEDKLREAGFIRLYIDVDDNSKVQLVYGPNDNIIAVNLSRHIETMTTFMEAEEYPRQRISPVTPAVSLEPMLGVSEKLVKKRDEDGTVRWVDPVAAEEDEEEGLISIYNDEHAHFSQCNLPFEPYLERQAEPLPLEVLTEKALHYLELVEGSIHDKYLLEEPAVVEEEHEPHEDDTEAAKHSIVLEPTQLFYFYRHYRGRLLEERQAHIHVGKYSGLIRECSVTRLTTRQEAQLQKLDPILPSH
ncbi:hypothetical protein J2S00_002158 [Caldalkalibacillus uzonensis]|uniref:Uncharacterized protein n=1 Tax=Caldalkalibacillus uzonensis TaxID=353224 RepID=A0ABU0CSH0_9BACI|nr:hypothetical protein [Caldalkalibacillus uzonensis]MDQ0339371.1 hypothetical protein [Caldalkalibacillus uzonensis]